MDTGQVALNDGISCKGLDVTDGNRENDCNMHKTCTSCLMDSKVNVANETKVHKWQYH